MSKAVCVIGPSGSGKSTFCDSLNRLLMDHGSLSKVINLDPGSESDLYFPFADIRELIRLDEVQEELSLGPNGGLMYCMRYLDENFEWLKEKLNSKDDTIFILDFPGQIELFTNTDALENILKKLCEVTTPCLVQLFDSFFCKIISFRRFKISFRSNVFFDYFD